MKRVTGIGGLFFKCKDPDKTKQWYGKHLGLSVHEWGASFEWRDKDEPEQVCHTAWSPFPADTDYFGPSTKDFMFNYRVGNLWMINFNHDLKYSKREKISFCWYHPGQSCVPGSG
jgi:catechol 2,3-dioxygenase-like lactoylglutathione lyase family enzyme